MKPHHRASLLLGCLGLLVLYLPDGLRVVGRWPTRPVLAAVPALETFGVVAAGRATLLPLPLPRPEGPTPPAADGALERVQDLYTGGQ